jgi:thiosulfate/3-mercaptopyruvate sulfurtransferase
MSWLIDPQRLIAEGPASNLALLEASVLKVTDAEGKRCWVSGRAAYAESHAAGARFADLFDDFSEPSAATEFTHASADRFAAAAARLGVGSGTRVVIYDRTDGIWAARLWRQFRALDFANVRVLDGGLAAYSAAGGALEVGESPAAAPTAPLISRELAAFWVDRDDVRAIVEKRRAGTPVCALRPPVFAGAERVYARPGHIPGSLNTPHTALHDASGRYLRGAALAEALGPILTAPGPLILYCGGGVSACSVALALTLCGRNDVAVYDGSLSEWAADPALPMTTIV